MRQRRTLLRSHTSRVSNRQSLRALGKKPGTRRSAGFSGLKATWTSFLLPAIQSSWLAQKGKWVGRSAIPLELKQTWKRERSASVEPPSNNAPGRFTERHYTLSEIAAMWNLSHDFVRRLFQNEPGVLIMGRKEVTSNRRRYATYRIPESVVERVHRRMSKIG